MANEGNVCHKQYNSFNPNLQIHKAGENTIDYSIEEERKKSFATWQAYFPVDPARLAKSGFYYTGVDDEVVCFSCQGHVKNWNYGDVVQKRHSEMFPNCDFVNNRSNNVPIIHSKKSTEEIKNSQMSNFEMSRLSKVINSINYTKMNDVQERLKTFAANWPLPYIDVSKVAQAGFFYLGFKDKVQCAFCKGIVSNWQATDDPLKEHIKHFPLCTYLTVIMSESRKKKVPWFQVNSEDRCGNVKMDVGSTSLKCRLLDKTQEHTDLKTLGVHIYSSPAHPQQASLSARLRSFITWPNSSPVLKEDLAKAGFFYIGIDDHTKCFHCNGGLCNWEQGDDPWTEHARWFRNCDFLRLNKGEAFIDSCVQGQSMNLETKVPGEMSSSMSPESLMNEVDITMKSQLVQSIIESNIFPSYIIRAAILRQLKETGSSFSTMDELCAAVSYLKDEMEKQPLQMGNLQPSDLNIHDVNIRKCAIGLESEGNSMEFENNTSKELPAKEPAKELPADEGPLIMAAKLLENAKSISTDQCVCKICMDKEVGVVFLPCGHLLACTECAPALNLCPMCRKTIQATVRAYLP